MSGSQEEDEGEDFLALLKQPKKKNDRKKNDNKNGTVKTNTTTTTDSDEDDDAAIASAINENLFIAPMSTVFAPKQLPVKVKYQEASIANYNKEKSHTYKMTIRIKQDEKDMTIGPTCLREGLMIFTVGLSKSYKIQTKKSEIVCQDLSLSLTETMHV